VQQNVVVAVYFPKKWHRSSGFATRSYRARTQAYLAIWHHAAFWQQRMWCFRNQYMQDGQDLPVVAAG
jgi:hypothetical protein